MITEANLSGGPGQWEFAGATSGVSQSDAGN